MPRWGGLLVAPRRTVAALTSGDGRRDGLWLCGLYLAGTELPELIAALAALAAVRDAGGVMMFASVVARVLLVPVLALLVAEMVLGRARAYRRAVVLLPLLLGATALRGLSQFGWDPPGARIFYDVAFALFGVGLVAWVRRHVPPEGQEVVHAVAPPRRFGATLAGLALVGLVIAVATVDLAEGRAQWSTLGPLPPGQPLPPFELTTLEGQPLPSSSFRGQVTVLAFWTTWCPACRSELTQLDEIDEAFPEVRFLAVNLEAGPLGRPAATELVAAFGREQGLQLPMALDAGAAVGALRIGPIPHLVMLDREGKIRRVFQGRVRTSVLRAELERLLLGS